MGVAKSSGTITIAAGRVTIVSTGRLVKAKRVMIVTGKTTAKTLSIRTFGGLTVHIDGVAQPVQFVTHTVEALLVYLACQGRELGRDRLAELLWPERTQQQARTNLRTTIYRLRQQLDSYLLVTRQSIALNPHALVDLDVARFEMSLASGQLDMATALYRGDFLDGFYLEGSPAFDQWALLERERLRSLAIGAYQQLIDTTASSGQVDAAIAYAQRLLSLDALHEPTHRQLMRLLVEVGQRSAALIQYETFRQLLITELDVEPDERTLALYEQIRTNSLGAAILEGSTSGAGLSTLPTAHGTPESTLPNPKSHNLPHQATPFIGRSTELAQIERLLANPGCRLLTLLGVGGIGKTRLAIEAVQRIVDSVGAPASQAKSPIPTPQFTDGVCFVSLASVGTAELVLVTIAQNLGLQITNSDLQQEIAAFLRPRALLLLLDNFEHLLEVAESIAYLLQNAPQLKVLVTSRERLYLREEWLLPIAGLSLADGIVGEAGQLFVFNAQRVTPTFTGRGEEAAIATVCQQVEGMPLAIELAASWVRVMPCADIALQIAKDLDFLTTRVRNLPERHRSIRALFDGSWRLLSLVEQGVLRRVSVFAGGWTLEEATAVAGATRTLLLDLADKSLVHATGHNRFELHELVRQYALEQLAANGETELLRHSHYATYLRLFRTGDSYLRGPKAATWLARLEPEQDNVRAALQWALDQARYEDATWLLFAVNWFWDLRGNKYEVGRWLAQLLPHRQTLANDLRLALLIMVYAFSRSFEEFQPVDRYSDEVMQLLEVCPHKLLHASVWHFKAVYATDFSQTVAGLERALAFVRASKDEPGLGIEFCLWTDYDFMLGTQLSAYAICLTERIEFARAEALARESLTLFRKQGNPYESSESLGILGRLALLQGDLSQAQTFLREAVTLAAAFSYVGVVCHWQPLLAIATLYGGNETEARRLLDENLRLCLNLKDNIFLARTYACLAEVALWVGELDQAAHWLAQSLPHPVGELDVTIYEIDRLFIAARLATAQQYYLRAATLFGLAEATRRHTRYELIEPVRSSVNAALTTLHESLDQVVFAASFTMGQQLSLDEAYATILAASNMLSSTQS
jgi:predicted ATPase/DNA-binding SARP family transcriptional activator